MITAGWPAQRPHPVCAVLHLVEARAQVLMTHDSPLITSFSPLTTHHSPLTTHHSPHYSPPTTPLPSHLTVYCTVRWLVHGQDQPAVHHARLRLLAPRRRRRTHRRPPRARTVATAAAAPGIRHDRRRCTLRGRRRTRCARRALHASRTLDFNSTSPFNPNPNPNPKPIPNPNPHHQSKQVRRGVRCA